MQAIAKWLLARPYNAVFGLTVTMLLPVAQLTSGAVLVLLVLAQGMRVAVTEATVAAAVLVLMALLFGGSFVSVIGLTVGTWVPVMLLVVSLVTMRSLTLTLQVSVIVAVAVMLLFQIVIPDPTAFWQPYVDAMVALVHKQGLQLDATMLTAEVLTISAVLVFWMLFTGALLLGYAFYRRLPVESADFGRFRDMDFGRVIAFTLALAALLAFVFDAAWLRNVALILFVMFMMQGLAIVHWLHGEGKLPGIAVVSVYVLLPILQVLLVLVLALTGYTDAWFGFRRRFRKA